MKLLPQTLHVIVNCEHVFCAFLPSLMLDSPFGLSACVCNVCLFVCMFNSLQTHVHIYAVSRA